MPSLVLDTPQQNLSNARCGLENDSSLHYVVYMEGT
jgi:hypothetical protein